MLELITIALFQFASFAPLTTTVGAPSTYSVEHGTGGWGDGHIVAEHGTGGWGDGHIVAEHGTGGWGDGH
jgi:hypothetical protein